METSRLDNFILDTQCCLITRVQVQNVRSPVMEMVTVARWSKEIGKKRFLTYFVFSVWPQVLLLLYMQLIPFHTTINIVDMSRIRRTNFVSETSAYVKCISRHQRFETWTEPSVHSTFVLPYVEYRISVNRCKKSYAF